MLYPYWNEEATRSSGADPVTGPGDVERDKKGLRETGIGSVAPSTITGIAGEGGLFEAEDWLLPELLASMYSVAPSVWEFLVAGVVAFGEPLEGVPN